MTEEKIELSTEWIEVIEQRTADIDAGVVQMVKADEVLSGIWAELE